jgi:hypothetical protein
LAGEETDLSNEFAFCAQLLKLDETPHSLMDLRTAVRTANERLCEHIRHGDFDEPARFAALARELRGFVERKLQTANPRYLASFMAAKEAKS